MLVHVCREVGRKVEGRHRARQQSHQRRRHQRHCWVCCLVSHDFNLLFYFFYLQKDVFVSSLGSVVSWLIMFRLNHLSASPTKLVKFTRSKAACHSFGHFSGRPRHSLSQTSLHLHSQHSFQQETITFCLLKREK